MIIGPRYKIGKRLGASVFEKCQTQKFVLSEARSKKKRFTRPKALSDFGKQLLEKQKVRYMYGVSEKQLSRSVKKTTSSTIEPIHRLYQFLEGRLDNVVYRMGIAPTRQASRQLVSHGHILVNDRRTTIPSFHAKVGDIVSIRQNSKKKGVFLGLDEKFADYSAPSWVSFDIKKHEGKVLDIPKLSLADASLDLESVLEYYSR